MVTVVPLTSSSIYNIISMDQLVLPVSSIVPTIVVTLKSSGLGEQRRLQGLPGGMLNSESPAVLQVALVVISRYVAARIGMTRGSRGCVSVSLNQSDRLCTHRSPNPQRLERKSLHPRPLLDQYRAHGLSKSIRVL